MILSDNRTSDFSYPQSLTSTGGNVACYMTLIPYLSTNKHSIYIAYGTGASTGSYSLTHNKVAPGTHSINIPASYFRTNNRTAVLQVDTYDKNNAFISGSFCHTIFLYHSSYKHYLCNVAIPSRTAPGENCSVQITPPKDYPSGGVKCDVDILYNSTVGRQYIAYDRAPGAFNFTVPDLATNSSLTIRITTKNSSGSILGYALQSIKIELPTSYTTTSSSSTSSKIDPPVVYIDDNDYNKVTISEGEIVKITGKSQNINDYKIIYAKQPCNVSEAVKDYTGINGYYDANRNDLHNKLIQNASGSLSYYVLKDFDASSTFMSQDNISKNTFYIRTPDTNDYSNIQDFYALQWFKDVEPGDLLYIYVIERGTKYTTTVTTNTLIVPTVQGKSKTNGGNWRCRKNNANNYSWWYISSNRSPYCDIGLAPTKVFLMLYKNIPTTATFTISMDRYLNYPPTIFLTTWSGNGGMSRTDGTYLTPLTTGRNNRFTYSVPVSFLQNAIASGINTIYARTHWGNNSENSAQFIDKYLELSAYQKGSTTPKTQTVVVPSIDYSDRRYNNITSIPKEAMEPYIVIPPAARPIELSQKEITTEKATISYPNPLYEISSNSFTTYKNIGEVTFDVSQGDDINDYSELNSVVDESGLTVEKDTTLDYATDEKRLLTYEKKIKLPTQLLNKIKNSTYNEVYLDLNINSIDQKALCFKDITSNKIKVQIMFSNSKEDKSRSRVLDYSSHIMEFNKQNYFIDKVKISKDLFTNNKYDTIHLLYNTDIYDDGKSFNVDNKTIYVQDGRILSGIGWNMAGAKVGSCTFTTETFKIASHANQLGTYKIRLCLENLKANKDLFAPPRIIVKHRNLAVGNKEPITQTELNPNISGIVKAGQDIYYEIPMELYNVNINDVLYFIMDPGTVYPVDIPDISFSNAFIEVVKVNSFEDEIEKYASGFIAKANFFEQNNSYSRTLNVDPVQCVDIIMCCFDSNRNLINKTESKRRDIYNGKEFIYYTDRKWHSFVNEKHKASLKYKRTYDMSFSIPAGTEYMCFIAFTYSNWHKNPSIYSMSNMLSITTTKRDFSIDFISPTPSVDFQKETLYANSEINNPNFKLRLNSQINGSMTITDNIINGGFNLATDVFDPNVWKRKPILYSNNKKFGYELPIFDPVNKYGINDVSSSKTPLYNDIEYYHQWSNMYGKNICKSLEPTTKSLPVTIDSNYTFYKDDADKFISNNAVPYIDIPAELAKFDRSKITIFLDMDFGKNI